MAKTLRTTSRTSPRTPQRKTHARRDFSSSIVVQKRGVPHFRNPLLLVGLPGIGFVSKLAADHLVRSLGAKRFATLYSPHFPNQVLALKAGHFKPFTLRFHHARLRKRDLVILRGDLQPLTVEGQYEVAAQVLRYFAHAGGTEVIAMAGYAVNKTITKPVVYATASHRAFFDALGRVGAQRVPNTIPIIGLAGLVPALAPLYGVRGACLLVETPGNVIDAKGAAELLNVVGRLVGEKFDAAKLEERAKKTQDAIRKLEAQAMQAAQAAQQAGVSGAAVEKPSKEALRYIT